MPTTTAAPAQQKTPAYAGEPGAAIESILLVASAACRDTAADQPRERMYS